MPTTPATAEIAAMQARAADIAKRVRREQSELAELRQQIKRAQQMLRAAEGGNAPENDDADQGPHRTVECRQGVTITRNRIL